MNSTPKLINNCFYLDFQQDLQAKLKNPDFLQQRFLESQYR